MKYDKRLVGSDSKKNFKIKFDAKEEYDYIKIVFDYSPHKEYDKEKCQAGINISLENYFQGYSRDYQPIDESKFYPIKNLITLSITKDEKYLGNAHKHFSHQEIIVSEKETTKGFISPLKITGEYIITINVHLIFTEFCDVSVEVLGGYYD